MIITLLNIYCKWKFTDTLHIFYEVLAFKKERERERAREKVWENLNFITMRNTQKYLFFLDRKSSTSKMFFKYIFVI